MGSFMQLQLATSEESFVTDWADKRLQPTWSFGDFFVTNLTVVLHGSQWSGRYWMGSAKIQILKLYNEDEDDDEDKDNGDNNCNFLSLVNLVLLLLWFSVCFVLVLLSVDNSTNITVFFLQTIPLNFSSALYYCNGIIMKFLHYLIFLQTSCKQYIQPWYA